MKNKITIVLIILIASFMCNNAYSEIPRKINFQAYIVDDNGHPINGSVEVLVELFDTPSGGSKLHTDRMMLYAIDGVINGYIGDNLQYPFPPINSIKFDKPYFIELTVNNSKIPERIPLTTTPYSFRSESSTRADSSFWAATVPDNSISGSKIQPSAIFGEHIQNGTITSNKLKIDEMLLYTFSPTFNNDNAIVSKRYVDVQIFGLNGAILDSMRANVATINTRVNILEANITAVSKRNDAIEQRIEALEWDIDNMVVDYPSNEDIYIINQRIDTVLATINIPFIGLHSTYLPYWNGSKFVDSRIRQDNENLITIGKSDAINAVRIGTAMFNIDNASNPTTYLRNLNTLATKRVESDFIGTDRVDYWSRFVDNNTKMPYDANELTLASKGYVDDIANTVIFHLENDWINGERIYDETITGFKIQNNSIWSNHIADNSILTRHIDAFSITNVKLADGSVDERVLANQSVTDQKIRDKTITGTKIADYTITWQQLATNSVAHDKIAEYAVWDGNIADNAVIERTIKNGNVTHDKIAHNSIDAIRLMANAVTNEKILDNAVTDYKLYVNDVYYRDNLAVNDYMPNGAAATTLTTKQYVDNKLLWNDTIRSNSADISALTLVNYNENPRSTALKIDSGRVVLGYIETASCNLQT